YIWRGILPWHRELAPRMRVLIAIFLACAACVVQAGQLNRIQLLDEGGTVRAVFSLDAAPDAHVFSLDHPARLVIDLPGVSAAGAVKAAVQKAASRASALVKDVRFGRHGSKLRVVMDLSDAVHVHHFALQPSAHYGNRLIVDLTPLKSGGAVDAPVNGNSKTTKVASAAKAAQLQPVAALHGKPIVIAVDAGHGGKDPGAHGPDGLEEKTVTLAIAKKLAKLIDAQPGMKAVLTRKGDYYVGLRQRTQIARKADADIFISIHCNAVRDSSVHGTSVYMLSRHGATSEQAHWLANRENAADMVGGIDIRDTNSQLASVLVDISQSATIDASFDLAHRLLHQMSEVSPILHDNAHVQRAAFVVLKAPDIPSVLVETDFITNPREERLLGNSAHQEKIARHLLDGIDGYFEHYRPKKRVPVQTASRSDLQKVSYKH
ncbi:MAG: N-acetylmuramoyl-L-alanine amidase, partial [Sinobacteraceae bacterium]|nr:N-acetylmuramoyl-L-alanine amidase [Nevskiaceae bacterium]